jgi:hypothetical protein
MTKRKKISYRSDKCLNCNTSLDVSEKYCHFCGQLNSTKKLTISDFLEEFFSNFYAYDSKIRNTLLFLFRKPGFVAKQITQGKRQTFANPFRLFLSISIILFLTINFTNKKNLSTENLITLDNSKNNKKSSIESLISKSKFNKDSIYTLKQLNEDGNLAELIPFTITSFRNFHIRHPNTKTPNALLELGYENTRLNQFIFNKSQNFNSNKIEHELISYVVDKLPFLIFLALPLLTIVFWLVFYDRKYNYAEVLVFTYTFYTFIFISYLSFELLSYLSNDVSTILKVICFTLIFPIYLYKSLRYFYETSRWKTIFKFVLLNILFIPAIFITSFFVIAIALILF